MRDNETPTLNMTIRVLAYIGHKWIVELDPLKVQLEWHICTHENTCLRKVSWKTPGHLKQVICCVLFFTSWGDVKKWLISAQFHDSMTHVYMVS